MTVTPPERQSDGVVFPLRGGWLKLDVCSDDVIRVAFSRDRKFFARRSLAAGVREHLACAWTLHSDSRQAVVATSAVQARVDLTTGTVRFFDHAGKLILAENETGRSMNPAIVQDEKTFHVRQQWRGEHDEALFGLGQNQLDLLNIKGCDLDLWQHNTFVAVPFLVSSRGYGILWDNTSFTRFGDLREFDPIPAAMLFDAENRLGGLTASYYSGAHFDHLVGKRLDPMMHILIRGEKQPANRLIHPLLPESGDISIRWEGEIQPASTGDYQFKTFSNSGIKLWLDDKLVIDHWRAAWLPAEDYAKVHLDSHRRCKVRMEWSRDQGSETIQLLWKTPNGDDSTSLWSQVGDGVDYYFVYGPSIDRVIAGYRQITGPAPMMPQWAFGLWQCRQRYKTQQESIDVVRRYRDLKIPLDNIVQDWFYWKIDQWGSHQFDPQRFLDPDGWVRTLHDLHARLMISVWGKFYPGTDTFDAMHSRGFLYEPNLREQIKDWMGYVYTFYDPFNAQARKLFWDQLNARLFSKGIDAWWMDASEPDLMPEWSVEGSQTHMNPTAMGNGSRMLNAYSLVNSQAIYEGQRQTSPDQRVFILTRCGFAGQQRYAAATWSGDTSCTWTALRKQIPAGLGFCVSGLPYWTSDCGGFTAPPRFAKNPTPAALEEWNELNARWFEFATFCPLLRVHGESRNREMWEFGGENSPTYQAQLKFDRLRYRLLPYIYSLVGGVTKNGGTLMRPLVMDFPDDATARNSLDQFMFGSAMLVNPITTDKSRQREVYLPECGWYDFWTGKNIAGGQSITADAPLDSIPLYVRAGSIIPVGPELQYTSEKPADPITLYIYTGADGHFSLYEDDGVTYACERGASTTIPISWNESSRTLTIGDRTGSFSGMLHSRMFKIVTISPARAVPFSFDQRADRTVAYDGRATQLKLGE